MTALLALAALLAWVGLVFARGMFWQAREDDSGAEALPDPAAWPAVCAIVPARDEAGTIAATVRSLRAQDYPGALRVVVVDDRSADGTGELARAAGAEVVTGTSRPPGWSGKLNALRQGLEATAGGDHALIWFTDADIVHSRDSLRMLVRRLAAGSARSPGEAGREPAGPGSLDMVSLMAKLRCESAAERWLIPAFVFFFAMLYPFRWVNDPRARTAAAAGGCVLLKRAAFEARGGLHPIRGRIIDDCALAALMKAPPPDRPQAQPEGVNRPGIAPDRPQAQPEGVNRPGIAPDRPEARPEGADRPGAIWLGLTERVRSLRAYDDAGTIRAMVARTAYAQLGYSPLRLAGCVAGMALVYLAPPLLALFAGGWAALLGAAAWGLMALAYAPMLRRYGLSPLRGLALPLVAGAYLLFTLDSARAEWAGRGGFWKGEALSR